MYSSTASRRGWTPLFFRALPTSTGEKLRWIVALRTAAWRERSERGVERVERERSGERGESGERGDSGESERGVERERSGERDVTCCCS